MAGVRDIGATASGVQVGAGADGTGIPGSRLIRSCRWMEFSIAPLAGDSIRQVSSTGLRSTADISTIHLMRPMFTPGDRVRITQLAALTLMASIRVQERRAELSTQGRQWRREVGAAASVAADSTAPEVVVDSMAEAVEATAEVAKAIR